MRPLAIALLMFAGCGPDPGADGGGADDTDAADTEDTRDPEDPADPGDPGGGSPFVDPGCIDGQWQEPALDPTADIRDLAGDFDTLGHEAYLAAALARRYPVGAMIFEGGAATTAIGDCIASFTSARDRSSAAGMLDASSTLVHECGHFFDIDESPMGAHTFVITDALRLVGRGGSYNETPARSRIKDDAWYALRPECPASGPNGCDFYAQLYLNGNPDNRQFESGDQGIDMLLEETTQYINSLATDYVFADRLDRGMQVSARDGILTFLWYTERYLRLMRETEPRAYDDILGDPVWREVILALWGRAWWFLDATDGIRSLSLEDDALMELVSDPELLAEIQAVRDAEGCR